MAIEGISGVGMTYQASTSNTEMKVETAKKTEETATVASEQQIATNTTSIDTKSTSGDGQGGNGTQQDAASLYQSQQAQIKKAVEEINKASTSSEAIFGIHEATNRVTIKIVDKETKEVIKELPPEKTLDMIAKVWELAGIMIDERR